MPAGDTWQRLAVLYAAVAQAVAADVTASECPVVLTGDCTTALGIVAGLQRAGADPAIVWFDAHGDVQTPETTASGYLGGLPLRLLAGYRPELIAARLGLTPVPEYRIVLAGARDLDPPEVAYLASTGIRRREVADLAVTDLPDGPLYVHVDLDVIDAWDSGPTVSRAGRSRSRAASGRAAHAARHRGHVAALGVACTWYPGHAAAAAHRSHLDATAGSVNPYRA